MSSEVLASGAPSPSEADAAFETAFRRASAFRSGVADRGPLPSAGIGELRAAFCVPLPDGPRPWADVIEDLANAAEPGLVGSTGPNFFAWVVGGSHPVGVAADWLTSAWGQNAGLYATSPAAAVAEEAVASWLLDLLDLPRESAVGLTTGATTAGFTCLLAARNAVLERIGWNVEQDGVFGAPRIGVFLGAEAHSTIFAALRYLGLGECDLRRVAIDAEGRMQPDDLARQLSSHEGPKIIIAQAGHINSGAFDPFTEIGALAGKHGAWLHIDGAFGLWARCIDDLRYLTENVDDADSWSIDGHKWLQAPYDTAFAVVKDARALQRAMVISASYLNPPPDGGRDPSNFTPELSRRARGFSVWALMQALGRRGVAEIVSRHCRCAKRLRDRLEPEPGIHVLNDVVLNQLAIAFGPDDSAEAQSDFARRVIERVQKENQFYVSGARWKGRWIMRVSITSGETSEDHIDRLASSILAAWREISRH